MKFLKTLLILIVSLVSGYQLYSQDKTYSMVFLNHKPDKAELPKEEVDKIMKGHIANINRLAKEDKLIVAGPFEGGGGIFILNTTSPEQAKEWLSTDPGVKANRWNIEIFPYTPRTGSVCKIDTTAKMVMYTFIRFIPNFTKFNIQESSKTLLRHDEYMEHLEATGNVIAEGLLGELDGDRKSVV